MAALGIVALMNLKQEAPQPQIIAPASERIPVASAANDRLIPIAKVNVQLESVPETDQSEQPREKPANSWAMVGMTTENESIRVEVVSVAIGKVEVKNVLDKSTSTDDLLQINIRMTNKSDAKKVDYRSWSASDGGFLHAASLRDDLDNSYKRISFGFGDTIIGQLRTESIYPFKSVTDLLVFEVPIERAKFLKLELPARAYGGSDDDELKLKIPTRVILGSSAQVRAADAEDKAVAFVKKLKGTVKRDQTLPRKPIIEVSLNETQVTDAELKELAAFKDLDGLALGFTQVTDVGLKELAAFQNLTTLTLYGTQVTDVGLKELAALKNLTTLDLYGLHVTDAGLKELAALKNLTTLTLSDTQVTDAGVKELQNALPKCKIAK